jgi:hypothetical protein
MILKALFFGKKTESLSQKFWLLKLNAWFKTLPLTLTQSPLLRLDEFVNCAAKF